MGQQYKQYSAMTKWVKSDRILVNIIRDVKRKALENRNFPGLLNVFDIKSALGELGRTSGRFEAVLLAPHPEKPHIFNDYTVFNF